MGRFPRRERWLAFALLAVWAVCFSLAVRDVARDKGITPIFAAASPEPGGYPRIVGFRAYLPGNPDLRVGDALISANGRDLRGLGALRTWVRTNEAAAGAREVELVYAREGVRDRTRLVLGPVRNYLGALLPSLAFALVAGLGVLRAQPSPAVRLAVFGFLGLAIDFTFFRGGDELETMLLLPIRFVTVATSGSLLLMAALRFPDVEAPRNPFWRHAPWLMLLRAPVDFMAGYGLFERPEAGLLLAFALNGGLGIWVLYALSRNYLRTDPIGRRQLKWIILSVHLAVIPMLLGVTAVAFDPTRLPWLFYAIVGHAVVPVGLAVSVARYNLFDIDRLLSSTASYTLLAIVGVAGVLTVIPWIAQIASDAVGLEPASGQLVLSVLFAVTAVPAHRRLRPQIDRLFFVERFALERGVQDLLEALASCGDAGALASTAGEGLDALLRPESLAIYARSGASDAYVPVFARGSAVAPAFEAGGLLVSALETRAKPLAAESIAASGQETLSPFDKAALETLGVPVIVPVRRAETLAAFVCLGPKRSGDVYTSTDLTLLTAVADKVSGELLRFDQEEVIRAGRAMQEKLRRYVPEAVADELSADRDVEAGEREVSVLFVDIRGYSSYAEHRAGEEIFSTLNRYTEAVSGAVRAGGGSIVEFSGDGMMAVFGAPRALESKESAAVAAGRAIIEQVSAFPAPEAGSALSVGVGIATGSAFVGTIRSADRHFWSAVGNTTNLASRLQALTRDLDVAMVIDAATWEALGADAADFEVRPELAIRGRSESEDVYVLPLETDAAGSGEAREAGDWSGSVLGGRYRVERALGSGGMGSAWLARDRRLERTVVVKVPHEALLLRPGYRERFAREVRHLTSVVHPHIVGLHDVGEHEKTPYAVVQFLGGGDVAGRVRDAGGRLTPVQVASWLTDVAGALDHVHAEGFVHRDVKPDNILFDEQGHVFLSDFGIATTLDETSADARMTPLTQPGAVLGALGYAPPEALDRAFSPAYDQYCLGSVVYEALCGALPFEGGSPEAVLLAKQSDAPQPLASRAPGLSPSLCDVVMRSLARDPAARFASCRSFAEAFAAALP